MEEKHSVILSSALIESIDPHPQSVTDSLSAESYSVLVSCAYLKSQVPTPLKTKVEMKSTRVIFLKKIADGIMMSLVSPPEIWWCLYCE